MDKVFILKHENLDVASIKLNDKHEIADINIINQQYLPLLSKRNGKDLKDNLKDWIINRGIQSTRHGIKKALELINSKDTFGFMLRNLGISLVDHYWICPINSQFNWHTVNSYINNFKFSMDLDLLGEANPTPNATLKGNLKKKWIISNNGTRYLVKGNYNNTCRQSISEVIASEIHKQQGLFEYTPYEYIRIYSDNEPIIGCMCPNFTSINTEFVPAIDLVEAYPKDNSISELEHYIRVCTTYGIDEQTMRNWVDYCIITNFIITNTDWHLNNMGIIVDSATRTKGKIAPIFDSGNSMFYNKTDSQIKVDSGLLNIKCTSWKPFEVQLLQYVNNPNIVDLSKLPSADEILHELQKDKFSSASDNELIVRAYLRKIEFVRELQSGVKIYSYPYLKKHGVKLKEDN